MIPLDVGRLITEGIIDNERIEYKKGWNPEKILHTICAFANDFDNLGGGYIVVGVNEKDGMPSDDIVGVSRDSIDRMNKELINNCKMIEPSYSPRTDIVDFEGKILFAIWAPGGNDRPYKCPDSLSSRGSTKSYYVRKMGSTVRVSQSEVKELFSISETIPFDDRMNEKARLSDLKLPIIENYLSIVGSSLSKDMYSMPMKTLAERMHLIDGPSENQHPVNVALMFFNERPDDFFREARIEVTLKPDPTGRDMTTKEFLGPLDVQIRGAVSFIRNTVLEEKTLKLEDRPEAERFYNYPMVAIEEAISNAVYHKSYQIPEPITIVVTRDRMEITSIPGPDRSISDADLRKGRLISKRYRNRRIGSYLKELDLAEGKNTGVPLIIESMEMNGSDPPSFLTDHDRSYFTVVLPVHRYYLSSIRSNVSEEVLDAPVESDDGKKPRRTRQEIIDEVLSILSERESVTMKELSQLMGYKSQSNSLKAVVSSLVSEGALDYTQDSKTSPYQRIRLSSRR